ncbi:sushi, von Willebrand factor type A, EGF and pentraxin domain-containing protein 1 isoform X2 [Lampris incognitus]|uniref:sushi, von Willebrand factor type A, EGF and pentraxin domain-containing protein 1 isoform X2 n=1 Tax=Lampris incognitus TaxID=2546036 RepID=UPI0024B4B10E|nr:sushi, von Willebrand factor type A, EGF and pentraxin domain-containing protein 1 isoform X2 [Lampris incognitus]
MELLLDTRGRRTVQYLLLLLLLCVSTVRAAASCPRPEQKQNAVLTDETLLKNDFPEGIDITFECAHGFTREDGSGSVTCTGGQWTELTLACKKIDCGPPQQQPHTSYGISENGTVFTASVKVLCDRGYQLSGASYKQCFARGWIGKSRCKPITCSKPAEVNNGRNTWDNQSTTVAYDEIIEYFCNEGYTLTGNNSIKCSENGRYDSLPPECKGDEDITKLGFAPSTEVSTPAGTSATLASHTAIISTTGITSAASTSTSPSLGGGRDTYTPGDNIITTRVSSTVSPGVKGMGEDVNTRQLDPRYKDAVIAVTVITLAAVVLSIVFVKLQKRKGSGNSVIPIC